MIDQIVTYGGAGLRGTDYSFLCFTDMSYRLNDLFGFNYAHQIVTYDTVQQNNRSAIPIDPELVLAVSDILTVNQEPHLGLSGKITIPLSQEVLKNYRSARSFLIGSVESERVADYFFGLATKVGSFFALPYDEVTQAKNGIKEDYLTRANEEGYVRIGVSTGIHEHPLKLIELTDKFCPVEKRAVG